jgi:hypothetical protein
VPAGGVEFGFGEAAEPGAFVVLLRDTSGRSCHRSRDALAYPLFDGGNVGVRPPYLQAPRCGEIGLAKPRIITSSGAGTASELVV